MKKTSIILSLITAVCAMAGCACNDGNEPSVNELLWYDAPATVWHEALPPGNSNMGTMVFGGVEETGSFRRHQFRELS